MLRHGLDYFTSSPGTTDQKRCLVCSSACRVKREIYGPTGWAAALARRPVRHDAFACPHADESWHREALDLVLARDQMPGKRVATLIQADLDELLQRHR